MGQKIIYLFTFILISGITFAQNNFDELITSGNQKIKEKNYKAAIEDLIKAKSIQPTDTSALNGLIRVYTLSGDYKEAQKVLNEAKSNHPNNPEFALRQGILYNLDGLHPQALEEFSKALDLNPTPKISLQILLNKASAEIKLEDYTNALVDYNKAIEIDPRNTNIYTYRGLVNFKLGYYLDAVTDYNNVLDLDPNSTITYYNRGMTLLRLSEKQKACKDFHKACQMGNSNACKMIITECGGR